jgi:zinc protease
MDGTFYGRGDLVTELENRLPKLTVERVNKVVRDYLDAPGFRVVIVTRDAAALRDAILSGKPTPIVYDTQGTPENVLAEDKQIAEFPLKDVKVKIVPVEEVFEK